MVVADDDPLSRTAAVSLLEADDRIRVVGEAATGTAAVELATDLRPDVLLVDIRMPELDGVEATRRVVEGTSGDDRPPVRVLVLTAFQDETTIRSLAAGASGFLLKQSYRDLVPAVVAVAGGEAWIDPAVAPAILAELRAHGRGRRAHRDVRDRLSPREREVAQLMVDGLYNEEIARELSVALPTVKTHITRIRTKTGSRNRVEAVVAVLRAGLARM